MKRSRLSLTELQLAFPLPRRPRMQGQRGVQMKRLSTAKVFVLVVCERDTLAK
jgi:hypothetical protein